MQILRQSLEQGISGFVRRQQFPLALKYNTVQSYLQLNYRTYIILTHAIMHIPYLQVFHYYYYTDHWCTVSMCDTAPIQMNQDLQLIQHRTDTNANGYRTLKYVQITIEIILQNNSFVFPFQSVTCGIFWFSSGFWSIGTQVVLFIWSTVAQNNNIVLGTGMSFVVMYITDRFTLVGSTYL